MYIFHYGLLPDENQCQGTFQRDQLCDRDFFKKQYLLFCFVLRSLKYIANIIKASQGWEKPHDCQKCWHEWCRALVSKCWSITTLKLTHQNRINDKMPKKMFPVKILEYFRVTAMKSVGTKSGNAFLKWQTDQKHLQGP